MQSDLFFSGWDVIGRTLVVGALAYGLLVVMLRVSGKRTLTKLNAFDLVVTVALGSTLATILLNRNVALVEGVTALALLIGLQFAVTWTGVRWTGFHKAVTGEPTLLLRSGELLPQALRRARITPDDVESAVRASGGQSLKDAEAVFLETDGSLSTILKR